MGRVFMEKFYDKLAEILEVDSVEPQDDVSSFENWDSLGTLAILAMIDSTYNVRISSQEMKNVKKVKDLENLVSSKMLN
jgi:acyl carrier protein